MRRGLLLGIGLLPLVVSAQSWPPSPYGYEYKWYFVPLNLSGQPSVAPNLLNVVRNPPTSTMSELLELSTPLEGGQQAWEFQGPPATQAWSGSLSYLSASWLSLGATSSAYGHPTQTISSEGTATFEARHRTSFGVFWIVDRESTTLYGTYLHKVFSPGRLDDREADAVFWDVEDINTLTTRFYILESGAISLGAERGLHGPSGNMIYTGSADASGRAFGFNSTIYADDEHVTGWVPDPTNYNQIPSDATLVLSLILKRLPVGENDTHFKFYGVLSIDSGLMRSIAHAKKISAVNDSQSEMPFESLFMSVVPQDPYPNRVPNPSYASAFSKNRLRIIDFRTTQINQSRVKVSVSLSGSEDDYAPVTYQIVDEDSNVVFEESYGADQEVLLPVDGSYGDYTLNVASEGYETESHPFTTSENSEEDAGMVTLYPSTSTLLGRLSLAVWLRSSQRLRMRMLL